jgi:hypothetical protein
MWAGFSPAFMENIRSRETAAGIARQPASGIRHPASGIRHPLCAGGLSKPAKPLKSLSPRVKKKTET